MRIHVRTLAAALGVGLTATALALPVGSASASSAPSSSSPTATNHRVCGSPTRGHATCFAVVREGTQASRPAGAGATGTAPSSGYGPPQIKAAYRLDQTRGAGQTIAVVDAYDNPKAAADLNAYRSAWKLPACTTSTGCFRKVNQRGGSTPPAGNTSWGLEIALDLDAVSAACPKCKILLVEADSNSFADLGAAVNRAVAMGADVVTNSYGGDEGSGVSTLGSKYYTHPGTAIVASSGDSGYRQVNFPAVWTKVISVGGTRLTGSGTSWSETAWSGAGSGCSAYIAKPSFQSDPTCAKRMSSDVSTVADPATGLAVYDTYGQGGWLEVGGTSLSSPLIAGMIGLAGNAPKLSSAAYIYVHRSGLYDVTRGSNGTCGSTYFCTAKTGYDGPTGLGTPRGLSAL